MNYSFSGGTNVFFTFAMPPLVVCADCGSPSVEGRTPDEGKPLCGGCIEVFNRKVALSKCEEWIVMVFFAVAPERRGDVYKKLSQLFHPDVGGCERLMKALNAARERVR